MPLAWRNQLSATDRFNSIEKISTNQNLDVGSAIVEEERAYNDLDSKEAYDTLVNQVYTAPQSASEPSPTTIEPDSDNEDTITIPPYQHCKPIAEGLTSTVYRSKLDPSAEKYHALKLITNTVPPHNPSREIQILQTLEPNRFVVDLIDVLRDEELRLVLVFPYYPETLESLLEKRKLDTHEIQTIFTDVLSALAHIHAQGIIHRDIKPSAILISPNQASVLSDFGTAWHPTLSPIDEPPTSKILDIGSGPYRAPEVLFADTSYGTGIDMWGLGVVLSQALRYSERPMFSCPPIHEDGNQLGLLRSIITTVGTPTVESWPEAKGFKCNPFEMFKKFDAVSWESLFPGVDEQWRDLVARLVRYSGRMTADEALKRIEML